MQIFLENVLSKKFNYKMSKCWLKPIQGFPNIITVGTEKNRFQKLIDYSKLIN
jgi:hypothetical protein